MKTKRKNEGNDRNSAQLPESTSHLHQSQRRQPTVIVSLPSLYRVRTVLRQALGIKCLFLRQFLDRRKTGIRIGAAACWANAK